jgi:hypothetical protein
MPKIAVRIVLACTAALAIALAPAGVSFAEHGSDDTSTGTTTSTAPTSTTEDTTTADTASGEHSGSTSDSSRHTTGTKSESETEASAEGTETQAGDRHLSGGKLKTCQNRQTEITSIMTRSVTRAQNQLDLFATIASRTEGFYTKRGKTLTNYDNLVAAIASAKAQAETDLQTLKGFSFSCDSSDPKGQITAFKAALATERSDLQAYRTAVKNLIVGVKSVQGATTQSEAQQ